MKVYCQFIVLHRGVWLAVGMGQAKSREDKHKPVVIEYVPVPDAEQRLTKAFKLILQAAAEAEEEAHTKPNARGRDGANGGSK